MKITKERNVIIRNAAWERRGEPRHLVAHGTVV